MGNILYTNIGKDMRADANNRVYGYKHILYILIITCDVTIIKKINMIVNISNNMSDEEYIPPPPPLRRYIRIPIEERTFAWEHYRPGPPIFRTRFREHFRFNGGDADFNENIPPPKRVRREDDHVLQLGV